MNINQQSHAPVELKFQHLLLNIYHLAPGQYSDLNIDISQGAQRTWSTLAQLTMKYT